MTKFKQVALALATAGLLATQAQAGEAQAPALHHAPLAAFSQQDIGSLFDQAGQPMQLASLSDAEMRETEGAWAPFVVWGLRFATSPTTHRFLLNTFNSSAFMPLAHYAHFVNQQRSRWW
jgi:hypothetical protein